MIGTGPAPAVSRDCDLHVWRMAGDYYVAARPPPQPHRPFRTALPLVLSDWLPLQRGGGMAREGKQAQPNYCSGEDYVLGFRSFRYSFNSDDFSQRVEQAAEQLELVAPGSLDGDAVADLIQLVVSGAIEQRVSSLGDYIVGMGDNVLHHRGESLVMWLRELLFRSAWLDMQILENQIECRFDDERLMFVYYPVGHPSREIGPPPHPSWKDVQYSGVE